MAILAPDLSGRPHQLVVEQSLAVPVHTVYLAWTEQIDRWFAAPGTVAMRPRIGEPFFFETHYAPPGEPVRRHPHYGRFLRLETDRLVELTWVTGAGGTEGAETVLTVEMAAEGAGTRVRLTHAGFQTAATRDATEQAWPIVLSGLEKAYTGS
ncbi:SRPBCC domain-containing protein [Nonomuraea sp. NPDC050556]|uniref:SRPBCC domain-containing protein n=1 Tax=Nonomuraea sp. NPDC050556 TaxID=3364369 RepID=UPI0037B5EE76